MQQNIIAIIWDFDKTLIKGYMQKPLFDRFGVNEGQFWKEVNNLYERYKKQGIKVNKDTIYLNHLITCTHQGILKGLNNKLLRELGRELEFYDGVPEIFDELRNQIERDKYSRYSISVENYIVSTGLAEMIRGSEIIDYVNGIWGCEFIETPIKSQIDIKEYIRDDSQKDKLISQVGYAIDNTSKTRAIFEINKGVNVHAEMDVNSYIPKELRRIPMENMIYIADGPSDVPVFSLLKQNNGRTFGVYQKSNEKEFSQVEQLQKNGRLDSYGEADYTNGTHSYMWLMKQVKDIADGIYINFENKILSNVSNAPGHLTE